MAVFFIFFIVLPREKLHLLVQIHNAIILQIILTLLNSSNTQGCVSARDTKPPAAAAHIMTPNKQLLIHLGNT